MRTNGGGLFTALDPRQPVTATPYASFAGGVNASGISGVIPSASIGAGSITSNMLAAGSVTVVQLTPGTVAANLAASGLGAVGSGGIVLSENSTSTALQNAGYSRLDGSINVPDKWIDGSLTPLGPASASSTIIAWTGSEMALSGWSEFQSAGGGFYNPAADAWQLINTNGAPVAAQVGVWTGSELLVAGSAQGSFTGARYHRGTAIWSPISTTNAPQNIGTAVWTGSRMIVWGGFTNTGAVYNPVANSWTPMTTVNALASRSGHTVVWTGTRMLVWGGADGAGTLASGGSYDPAANSWTPLSLVNAPLARAGHTAIWTGSRMIVWGGATNAPFGTASTAATVSSVASYNPATDTWTPVSTNGAPKARFDHTATWSGTEMIIWGGQNLENPLDGNLNSVATGARYNPILNAWMPMTTNAAPVSRTMHSAVWSGSELIVWGGMNIVSNIPTILNPGARYNPSGDTWTALTLGNAPAARQRHTAVWADDRMIVWGGDDAGPAINTGASYSVTNNGWTALPVVNAPVARINHTAVWTGREMVIWGGLAASVGLNTGGVFNPTENSWTTTTTLGGPSGRTSHTAVWTGREMWIFGGARAVVDATPIRAHAYVPPRTLYLWLSQNSGSHTNTITIVNVTNTYSGPFVGNGAGLTNLNPANLISGTAAINITGNAAGATSFFGPLSGDVTGTQNATTVATVGGQSAANIAAGANAALAGTSTNTPNTIVRRNASGNFAAGAISAASFSGSGSNLTALNAGNIAVGILTATFIDPAIARDNEILPVVLANDGAGSGLDADVLDGLNATAFATATHTHNAADVSSGILPVVRGGTGAGTPAEALANLGAASLIASNTFSGVTALTNVNNTFVGTFAGSGAGLSNLNAGNLTGTLPTATLANGSIADSKLATITTAGKVADSALSGNVSLLGSQIESVEISDGTITSQDIANDTITGLKIANETITTFDILDGSVASVDITDGTLVNADINTNAAIVDTKLATIVTAGKVADSALSTNVSLLGPSIVSSEIADDSIVNADINANAAIVDTKLATIATAGKVADTALSTNVSLLGSSISSIEITDGTIVDADISGSANISDLKLATIATAGKVADTALSANVSLMGGQIESIEIANGTITSTDIAIETIMNANINVSAGILDTKLATIATPGKVADSALSANVSLLGSSISSSEITDGTITATDIADGTVASVDIADGTIVNADINASAAIADTKLATIATAGKVADTALSANVALLNRNNQAFTGTNTFGGKVGIGTTDPGAFQLRVDGNARPGGGMTVGKSGGQHDEIGFNVGFTGVGDTYTYVVADTAASLRFGFNGDLEFRTASVAGPGTTGGSLTLSNRMIINQTGNVGIGTLSPTNKLHVAGGGDTTITTIDPDGVALAAIQGLNQKMEAGSRKSEVRIQSLEAQNAELTLRLEKLERLMNQKHRGAR